MEMQLQTTQRAQAQEGALVEVESSRAASEVQAAMVVAKRFPRDEQASYNRIIKSCERKTLAEEAIYTYPRGGTQVEGPSIRLAECIAQAWGNIQCGVIELSQSDGESEMLAFCWDLETNFRDTKIFTVPHERHTKDRTYALTDPRDIYEHIANVSARRKRACILAVIPGDIVDGAVGQCKKTLKGGHTEGIDARIHTMVEKFAAFGVTAAAIEARLGHRLESTTENELVTLGGIYNSISNRQATPAAYFDLSVEPKPAPDHQGLGGPVGSAGGGESVDLGGSADSSPDPLSQPPQFGGHPEKTKEPGPDKPLWYDMDPLNFRSWYESLTDAQYDRIYTLLDRGMKRALTNKVNKHVKPMSQSPPNTDTPPQTEASFKRLISQDQMDILTLFCKKPSNAMEINVYLREHHADILESDPDHPEENLTEAEANNLIGHLRAFSGEDVK